jgi:uncharacterized protein YbjT (DUF2867 family)
MILVTGASGKTGRTLIRELAAKQQLVRAWVRRPQLIIDGAAEMMVGNLESSADWARAVDGVNQIYLICPNMHPHEKEIGRLALSAALKAGVRLFVYHSVLHPQTEAMPHHWAKLRVEEMIVASGVPFVILQPTAYMQNLRPQLVEIKEKGILRLPYPPGSRISLVDLGDVAAVAAKMLLSYEFAGGIFELCGTEPISQYEVAQQFGTLLARPIIATELPLAEWESNAQDLPDYARQTLIKMFRYYAEFGLVGNPAVLTWLLGRPSQKFADVIRSWLVA